MDSFALKREQAGVIVDGHGMVAPDVCADDSVRHTAKIDNLRRETQRSPLTELQ